ncbi:hypothetical protein [[Scytonema hofmanni] UTEX B 1581]|nr:hypothetical protein [[Scytonema hofmanni] UTEX B 1581]
MLVNKAVLNRVQFINRKANVGMPRQNVLYTTENRHNQDYQSN